MASAKKKLQGLVAATITPMTENGEINFSVIGQYVDYLVKEQGVKNVFVQKFLTLHFSDLGWEEQRYGLVPLTYSLFGTVNGTTGEGLSLSVSERRRVAEEWVTKGKDKLDQVIIHVGALSLKESQELAQHAAEIGADGIAVIAPFFLKPWTKDVLIDFLKEVAAAAPALPFYYYHIPALTGVKIRAEELLDGIQDKIPTFQGLKFSDTDLLDFGQCVDQHRQQQFAFLFGVDEQLLSALVMGATGAVGSTYNYLGKKTGQMLEAFERKDFSLALNYQRFINFVVKLGFGVSQTKAIMTLVSGIPMGPPRLPLQKASREFTDCVEAKLKSLDFLSFTDLKDGNLEAGYHKFPIPPLRRPSLPQDPELLKSKANFLSAAQKLLQMPAFGVRGKPSLPSASTHNKVIFEVMVGFHERASASASQYGLQVQFAPFYVEGDGIMTTYYILENPHTRLVSYWEQVIVVLKSVHFPNFWNMF
ncbi:hypothetical protein P7K49_037689 [Saguinus oedipus]|uniref:N-acetylneuraminate lyase n=1 Tax=Saguinus oedipus TaxID=9490 RepID=A0ABQ9TIW0_SAGOE|nr:hypothetical protein P7K49_037689 [Saguinus oedipus]